MSNPKRSYGETCEIAKLHGSGSANTQHWFVPLRNENTFAFHAFHAGNATCGWVFKLAHHFWSTVLKNLHFGGKMHQTMFLHQNWPQRPKWLQTGADNTPPNPDNNTPTPDNNPPSPDKRPRTTDNRVFQVWAAKTAPRRKFRKTAVNLIICLICWFFA